MAPYKSRKVVKRPVKKRQPRKVSQAKRNHVPTFMSKVSRWNKSFGFPDRLVVKLRYDDIKQLTMTSGALGLLQFNMNSIFDPDITGTGHQPMYHDQYQTIYNHYSVLGSKLIADIQNPSATVAVICGIGTSDDTTVSSTFQTLMENNHASSKIISNGTASNYTRFKQFFSAKKDLQIDPYASQTYKTSFGSDPSETTVCTVWGKPIDGSSTLTCYVRVEIEYTVLLAELKEVTQS